MLLLLVEQFERVGFLIAMAFLFSRMQKLRHFMHYQEENKNIWLFILLFSFFAILGTYSGLPVTGIGYRETPLIYKISGWEAIATARTIGIVIAGLFGGVRAGICTGLIAGIHRYSLGGFVAFPCLIASILEGILAGLMKNSLKKRYRQKSSILMSFLVGFLSETVQMAVILLLAHPFDRALSLVQLIGIPQILANSLGVASFFVILIQVTFEEERIGAFYAQKALKIAESTLSYWRKPLKNAVTEIGQALLRETGAIGIIFQQKDNILFQQGELTSYKAQLPIEYRSYKIGAFQLFYKRKQDLQTAEMKAILNGLGQLFSQQYALAEAERQAHLVTNAEIKALQAQMDPHFLFNVLNTIKSLIRTSPEESRKMITQLAKYLRKNMQSVHQDLITIKEELEHVKIYLSLVKARMGDRLQVEWMLDENCLDYTIPSLTIQPLVENAIVHGIKELSSNGSIKISVLNITNGVKISVLDNGKGMETNIVKEDSEEHMGFALKNIQERLFYHFGDKAHFTIESQIGKGTLVAFIRPNDEALR
ncbi:LytS/YhcK type 5TM receptor domain-containing protein [Neobacillus sp. PS3-12]|jgi:two-component system, LytTR family, sensor histidine kinase LytS|uniref:LytS/YhcK type 5TM receptor domain-containing protein n=1 Tax=Neobacillus sp. PS3-12 TaxID=3070677 RepID=UPI0027E08060|nr:LytS/YhcK type 5TM receptor domain-containing protein [Neobacillus sp. PS3-12]WML51756.1 LytS/YhcK type 5TM receptor domain-containing protein [Neobacillus sp. PS3-12]